MLAHRAVADVFILCVLLTQHSQTRDIFNIQLYRRKKEKTEKSHFQNTENSK